MRRLFPVMLAFALCGCTSSRAVPDEESHLVSRSDSHEDRARERATDDLSGETFEDVGDIATCTIDCSGHEAGFAWAREHEIEDSSDCGGRSQSFREGCETYADALEERTDDARSDEDDGDDQDQSDEQ